jgi:hypothetical protein
MAINRVKIVAENIIAAIIINPDLYPPFLAASQFSNWFAPLLHRQALLISTSGQPV